MNEAHLGSQESATTQTGNEETIVNPEDLIFGRISIATSWNLLLKLGEKPVGSVPLFPFPWDTVSPYILHHNPKCGRLMSAKALELPNKPGRNPVCHRNKSSRGLWPTEWGHSVTREKDKISRVKGTPDAFGVVHAFLSRVLMQTQILISKAKGMEDSL